MWFWWYMLFCNLLIPIIMIVSGRWMWKHYPQEINSVLGYRTKRSMKNMDTWKFANEHCGRLWWRVGWILLIPTILVQIPFYGSDSDTIGTVGVGITVLWLMILIASLFPTEAALKKTFFEDGTRR